MKVRLKMANNAEIATLPRKKDQSLVSRAKATVDEDVGTARLVARARKAIASGAPLIPKRIADRIAKGGKRAL
jgi:hypothetical protein